MVGYIEKPKGGDFAPTPEGVHLMVCKEVIDLGTQPGSQMYPKPKRKVVIRWELPECRVEWEKDNEKHEGPAVHMEKYTWSFHENASLRQVLENWRGKAFVEEDFAGPPNGFHVGKLIGAPMRGQVIHEAKGDKTFANLSTVMAAGIKREEWPELEGPSLLLDLDKFEQSAFDRLSEYWQDTIKSSPEYQLMFSQSPPDGTGMDEGQFPPPQNGADIDDEIPF